MRPLTSFFASTLGRLAPSRALQFPFTLSNSGGDLVPVGASYTIETWFKLTAWENERPGFIESESQQMLFLGAGAGDYSIAISLRNDGTGASIIDFYDYTGGTLTSPALVQPQRWQHLRFSYDAVTREAVIHVDNEAVAQGTFGAPQRPLSSLYLGHINSFRTAHNVNGQMDETRVWPYVRAAAQNLASWQRPNHRLPDLSHAAAAWSYEDNVGPTGAGWAGFADGSGHGQHLLSSTNSYEGGQAWSTIPFAKTPAARPSGAVVLGRSPAPEQYIPATPAIALGADWAFEVRLRRDTATPSYCVTFNSATYLDAFGIYAGFGPGGYTFFARDATDATNLALAITSLAESPVDVFQVIRLCYAAGVLRGFADGVEQFWMPLSEFRFDSPVALVLGYRSGAPQWEGAIDYLFVESAGVRLFDYSFDGSGASERNAGTVGGQLLGQNGATLVRTALL